MTLLRPSRVVACEKRPVRQEVDSIAKSEVGLIGGLTRVQPVEDPLQSQLGVRCRRGPVVLVLPLSEGVPYFSRLIIGRGRPHI